MIIIKKLSLEQKHNKTGGSFYAIALGIGILVATLSSLVMNILNATHPGKNVAYGYRRSGAMLRLSPVPSRSALMLF